MSRLQRSTLICRRERSSDLCVTNCMRHHAVFRNEWEDRCQGRVLHYHRTLALLRPIGNSHSEEYILGHHAAEPLDLSQVRRAYLAAKCFSPFPRLLLLQEHHAVAVFRPVIHNLFELQSCCGYFFDQHFLRNSMATAVPWHTLHLA